MHGENIRRTQGAHVRGRYGTGKCAAFGIADVLRVETVKDGLINIVEIDRRKIMKLGTGDSFPVEDVTGNRDSALQDGTTIIISGLNLKNVELQSTVAFVERQLGRQLQSNMVVINGHLCEYQEPYSSWQRDFQPKPELQVIIGDIQLVVKVSPTPLDKERAGVDILSNTIWHETWAGSLEGEIGKRVFGEVDVPILESNYDEEKIPPFDNTRNMTLNQSNPRVSTLLGWIDECLKGVTQEIMEMEKERRATEEAKRLEKQATIIEKLLNADFKSLELELERIRRKAKALNESEGVQDIVPGEGDIETRYQLGGPEHGDGKRGEEAGIGEEERPGSSLIPGEETGGPSDTVERKTKRSSFHVDYRHEEVQSQRSHYEREIRTIVVNLDHPQVSTAITNGGGIDGKQFREITYEIALVEYAIALGHERQFIDAFYSGSDALFDIRESINRVSAVLYT